MAKTGPARPGNRDHDPDGDSGELDTTIENLTIEVAKAAKINATPIVIGVVVILGLIMLPTVIDKFKEHEIQASNNEIDASLAGEADEVRARIPGLLESFRGQAIETYTIERIARWYWDQGDDASRQEAIELLQNSQQRFPENFLINSYLQEFRTSQEASSGFVLPEPPAPEPEPVVTTDATTPPAESDSTTTTEGPTLSTDATPDATPTPTTTGEKPQLTPAEKPSLQPAPPPTEQAEPKPEGKPEAKPEDLGPPPPTTGGDGN